MLVMKATQRYHATTRPQSCVSTNTSNRVKSSQQSTTPLAQVQEIHVLRISTHILCSQLTIIPSLMQGRVLRDGHLASATLYGHVQLDYLFLQPSISNTTSISMEKLNGSCHSGHKGVPMSCWQCSVFAIIPTHTQPYPHPHPHTPTPTPTSHTHPHTHPYCCLLEVIIGVSDCLGNTVR